MKLAERLNLPFVPVLFEGTFTSWADYTDLVGKTTLGSAEGEGILPENWDAKDMVTIRKHLPKMIYDDCVKDENDTVQQCENFGKHVGNLSMNYVKEILNEKTGASAIL